MAHEIALETKLCNSSPNIQSTPGSGQPVVFVGTGQKCRIRFATVLEVFWGSSTLILEPD